MDGQEAFDLSVYDKSLLESTVLQDTDGQFVGLSVAEDLAFALENDMESQQVMHQKIGDWGRKTVTYKLIGPSATRFIWRSKATCQFSWSVR